MRHPETWTAQVMFDRIIGPVWRNSINDTFNVRVVIDKNGREVNVGMTRSEAERLMRSLEAHLK